MDGTVRVRGLSTIRWFAVVGAFALAAGCAVCAQVQASPHVDATAWSSPAQDEAAGTGEGLPLALKVTIEEAWSGDGVRAALELVNSGRLSVTGVSVRICIPEGWAWGAEVASEALPAAPPWTRAVEDHSSCRRFLLGTLPGRRVRRFAVDLIRWPPAAEGARTPFDGLFAAGVLDISVFASPGVDEPPRRALSRSLEVRPSEWSFFGSTAGEAGGGEPPGLAARVALMAGSEVEGAGGGRAGAHWRVAGEASWGAVSAELQAVHAWDGGLASAVGGARSLTWTSTAGKARLGSPSHGIEIDWHRGPAKVVSLSGVRPTLPASSAWSAGAGARAEVHGGAVVGRLSVGEAEGDIWSCRLVDGSLGWERGAGGAVLRIAEVANTTINTRGPREGRAALAQLEASTQADLGGSPWSVRGLVARGVPRTLTPSCGLSPKDGWRLRLAAEAAGQGFLKGIAWTAAWPREPRADRPFTHEVAAALSIPTGPGVSVEAEPALRLGAGGQGMLALRTRAEVGPRHRFRFELGPAALTPASDLPRAGEGAGRVLAGWDVPRGPVRPRLAYEREQLPSGWRNEVRGGLTLLGSARVPWSAAARVEGSVRLARSYAWGAKGESYENLLALRLGRRPSTVRVEWTSTGSQRRVHLAVEYEPGRPAAVARAGLSVERVIKDAGLHSRMEGRVEGRWTRGRWGGALAYAIAPAGAGSGTDAGEELGAEELEAAGDAVEAGAGAKPGATESSGAVAASAFVTWELGRWELRGEWSESAHTQEPPGFVRRVELQGKRWFGDALSLAVKGGYCWLGSEPRPCPPQVRLEWLPPLAGGGAVVALQVEFRAGNARAALSMSAPIAW